MNRRTILGGVLAMVWQGGDKGPGGSPARRPGGLPGPRADQISRQPATGAPPTGGAAGNLRARSVNIAGPGQLLVGYSPTRAAGNLVFSDSPLAVPTKDRYGNVILAGRVSYVAVGPLVAAVQLALGQITYYTATSQAGPYTAVGAVGIGAGGGATGLTVGLGSLEVQDIFMLAKGNAAPPVNSTVGQLYVDSTGALQYLSPGGTSTRLAPG